MTSHNQNSRSGDLAAPTRELIIDNFAGGGGASTGIELALGVSPDYAINHDEIALAMHEANHPTTKHLQNNVWKIDPDEFEGPIGLGWFSPDCKHFSKAKGGKPVERGIRDLAWVVVRWARRRAGGPRVIILENVEEFRTWGPLGADNLPCPVRKGETFKRWVGELKRLGYQVDWRELRACDYGAPTIRKRLFLIARNDGEPIVWPAPTHGDPKSEAVQAGQRKPWRTAAEIIDWSLPCHSIFLTKEEGRAVGVKRPLVEATMSRVAKGIKRYVLDAAKPFIVNLTHHGGERTESIDEPMMTVTGAHRGEKAIAMPFVSAAQQGGLIRDIQDPHHTVTASRKDQNQIVLPHLTKFRANSVGASLEVPAPTVTANSFIDRPGGAAPIGLVAAHVMTMRNAQKPFNGADEPTQTVTSGGARLHLVAAFLAQHNIDGRTGEGNPGRRVDEPVSTILQTGSHQGLAAVNLCRQFGTGVGSSVEEPTRTVMTDGGGKTQMSAAFLQKYYGTDQDPQLEEALHTVTTKDRFGLVKVMIEGEPYVINDIGLRMLAPRELFRAQGFPDSYIIDRRLDGRPITKTDQVAKCGNSVCPDLARALVAANVVLRNIPAPEHRPAFFLEAAE